MRTKVFFIAALLSIFLVSCCNEDQQPLPERIVGKWVFTYDDVEPAITDDQFVITFTSSNKAYVSTLLYDSEDEGGWAREAEFDVSFNAETVAITGQLNKDISVTALMLVETIHGNAMTCECKVTEEIGEEVLRDEYSAVFIRTEADFRQDIIGTWEGDELSNDDSGSVDGVRCRFEYLPDGTYNYYRQNPDGTWKKSDDDYSYYFCDGYLLFMRWKNVGDDQNANSICWQIDIRNGVMQWNALRERDDESIYELNMKFTKVE